MNRRALLLGTVASTALAAFPALSAAASDPWVRHLKPVGFYTFTVTHNEDGTISVEQGPFTEANELAIKQCMAMAAE